MAVSKHMTNHLRGACLASLLVLCGTAGAATLPALPAVNSGQSSLAVPALTAAPSSISALPALPGAVSGATGSAASSGLAVQNKSALPGLDGNAVGNRIRPIRIPNVVPLPVNLPLVSDSQVASSAKAAQPDAIRPIRLPNLLNLDPAKASSQ